MNLLETRKTSKRELIEERRQYLIKDFNGRNRTWNTVARFGGTLTEKDGLWCPCLKDGEWVEKGYPADEGDCCVCKRSVEPDEPITELFHCGEYDDYFYICEKCLKEMLNKIKVTEE